ncbi:MAG: hypothetical protein ACI8QF_000407, partial [Limisphaerales bacterium]
HRAVTVIQIKPGFQFLCLRAMAFVTMLGKNGSDLRFEKCDLLGWNFAAGAALAENGNREKQRGACPHAQSERGWWKNTEFDDASVRHDSIERAFKRISGGRATAIHQRHWRRAKIGFRDLPGWHAVTAGKD